jgi:hypothetical protein
MLPGTLQHIQRQTDNKEQGGAIEMYHAVLASKMGIFA